MLLQLQDLYQDTRERYQLKLLAGAEGLSDTVSWVYRLEDLGDLSFLTNHELVITTGFACCEEEQLLEFVRHLAGCKVSGLIINMGRYIQEIPQSVMDFCDKHKLPLLTMPWQMRITQISYDYCTRIFQAEQVGHVLSNVFLRISEDPTVFLEEQFLLEKYGYEQNDQYTCLLVCTESRSAQNVMAPLMEASALMFPDVITMAYRNAYLLLVHQKKDRSTVKKIKKQVEIGQQRMLETGVDVPELFWGIGNPVEDILQLRQSLQRAAYALRKSVKMKIPVVAFDEMGYDQLLYAIEDRNLAASYLQRHLQILIDYDRDHKSDYLQTLRLYLYYDASVQQTAAASFVHRNTVNYRIQKIQSMLGVDFSVRENRFSYQLAFAVMDML